jgi:hypothetical protein
LIVSVSRPGLLLGLRNSYNPHKITHFAKAA